MTHAPILKTNPFDRSFLADPYAHHATLRDTGPVVWLDSIGVYGMAGYAEVQATLKDHGTFCSGRGVPHQWQKLRDRPSLARGVFDESLRWDSTAQTFFRTATRDSTVAGVNIPEGSKVLLFLAAANRDPRHWSNPERFAIERKNSGHVGFGFGLHQCLGQMVARQEAELVLGGGIAGAHGIRVHRPDVDTRENDD